MRFYENSEDNNADRQGIDMMRKARTILKQTFGYDDFRPFQGEVIRNVLQGRDSLVIMPTGGGKSLCYQIPALVFDGLTVVVSPLISLMQDQVEQLNACGIAALVLNSSLPPAVYRENVRRIRENEARLLYLAPETLLLPRILSLLSDIRVDCVTIDEAHCISEWGHDFRPEYRQLIAVRERFPGAVCVALTATATPRVRQDIKTSLCFRHSADFIASFNRDNLFIEIARKSYPVEQTIEFLRQYPGEPGIIYCFSRRQVDELSEILADEGFAVLPYHAGLNPEIRQINQERFIRDDIRIIVATIAFGMGINKSNVRFVLHFDMPQNIESYYQQIGRAGRDGSQAHCLLLFSDSDIRRIRYFNRRKGEAEQEIADAHLNALMDYIKTGTCRRIPLLGYFGETYAEPGCRMCDNCRTGGDGAADQPQYGRLSAGKTAAKPRAGRPARMRRGLLGRIFGKNTG